jgi:hypothetical protein
MGYTPGFSQQRYINSFKKKEKCKKKINYFKPYCYFPYNSLGSYEK